MTLTNQDAEGWKATIDTEDPSGIGSIVLMQVGVPDAESRTFTPPYTRNTDGFIVLDLSSWLGNTPSQDVAIVMGASSGCVGLPGPPVLLTPVVAGNNVALDWNAPTVGVLTTAYVLMAGSAAGSSDLAYFGTGSAVTAFAASAPAGLYFVRVAASNACGDGAGLQ